MSERENRYLLTNYRTNKLRVFDSVEYTERLRDKFNSCIDRLCTNGLTREIAIKKAIKEYREWLYGTNVND